MGHRAHAFAWLLLRSLGFALAAAPVAVQAGDAPVDAKAVPTTGAVKDAGIAQGQFDLRFLSDSARNRDLSRLTDGGDVPPGRFRIDVHVNGVFMAREEIEFARVHPGEPAQPCLSGALLRRLGVRLPDDVADDACVDLGQRIEQASLQVDFAELAIHLGVPQAALRRDARGAVDRTLWQVGEDALMLGYSYNRYRTSGIHGGSDTAYLGVELGANLGRWQYRQRGAMLWSDDDPGRWISQSAYLQRALPRWSGRLQLGHAIAGDASLGAYGFRGLRVSKDERMVPDAMRGYAPVVRGAAASQAVVEIRQRGNLIHRRSVAPGPFAFDDLYVAGNGGDLDVAVIEADGAAHRYRVANASNPQLRRAGSLGYEFVLGQVQERMLEKRPTVAQASLQYGFSNAVTGYGAALASEGYTSLVLGSAVNTGWGALSIDANPVRSDASGSAVRWRAGYNRRFDPAGAILAATVAVYDGGEHLDLYSTLRQQEKPVPSGRARAIGDSAQLSLSWPLQDRASLHVTGSRQRYRDGTRNNNVQLGMRRQWRQLGILMTVARVNDIAGRRDDQYFVGLTVPLGYSASANASVERAARGSSVRLGVGGSLGEAHAFGYGASVASGPAGAGTRSASALYRSAYSTLNVASTRGRDYRQHAWGADGTIVLHRQGLTLGPQHGETMGLVQARGAHGARVLNQSGVRIDRRGYALAPQLIPYARNIIELDAFSARSPVTITGTRQAVVPYAGALVRLDYPVRNAAGAILHVRDDHGGALPFAAEVLDQDGRIVGSVGQGSRIHATGLAERGRLRVQWHEPDERSCSIDYAMPSATREATATYASIETVCRRDDVP